MKRLLLCLVLLPLLTFVSTAQRSGELLNHKLQTFATLNGNVLEYSIEPLRGFRIVFDDGVVYNYTTRKVYMYYKVNGNTTIFMDENKDVIGRNVGDVMYDENNKVLAIISRTSYNNTVRANGMIATRYAKNVPDYVLQAAVNIINWIQDKEIEP